MKIDEFIKKASRFACPQKCIDGAIRIYSSSFVSMEDYWLFELFPRIKDLRLDWNWNNAEAIDPASVFNLMRLITKLKSTPVDERFPGKRWRLKSFRISNDQIKTLQYVDRVQATMTSTGFHFTGNQEDTMLFTAEALNNLRDFLSEEAIDAMKEEINNDEI